MTDKPELHKSFLQPLQGEAGEADTQKTEHFKLDELEVELEIEPMTAQDM